MADETAGICNGGTECSVILNASLNSMKLLAILAMFLQLANTETSSYDLERTKCSGVHAAVGAEAKSCALAQTERSLCTQLCAFEAKSCRLEQARF